MMSDIVQRLRDYYDANKPPEITSPALILIHEAAGAIEKRDQWMQELQAALCRWLPHWRGPGSPMLNAIGDDCLLLYGMEGKTPEYGEQIYQELERYRALAEAVDRMIAAVGYHGEINARDDRVQAVMDALHKVDPK